MFNLIRDRKMEINVGEDQLNQFIDREFESGKCLVLENVLKEFG